MLNLSRISGVVNGRTWMLILIISLISYNLLVCAYYRISQQYASRRWLCWFELDDYVDSCNINFASIKYPLTWELHTFWFNVWSAMMGVICLTGILLHHRSSLVFGTLGYALFFAYEIYITIVCLTKTHLCLVCSSNNIINRTYYALIGVFFVQLGISLLILCFMYIYQKKAGAR